MRKQLNSSIITRAILATLAFTAAGAMAQSTLYWDANGNLAGNGAWDVNSSVNWSTTGLAGGADSAWLPNDGTVDASFGNANYTATIPDGTTINAHSVTLTSLGALTLAGGTLNLANSDASIVMDTNFAGVRQNISTDIAGGDITIVANDSYDLSAHKNFFLALQGNNTFTGNLILAGNGAVNPLSLNQVRLDTPGALPSTANVEFVRDLTQLLFLGTATYSNNINLNASGSGMLSSTLGTQSGADITLNGLISGNADFVMQVGYNSGTGTLTLGHANNTWTGATILLPSTNSTNTGVLQLGVDNALPQGTTLDLGGTGAGGGGAFDLAGHNQTIGGLSSGTNPTKIAGIVNTTSTLSTLTINGSGINTYNGTIGVPTIFSTMPSNLSGVTNHIALHLAGANTGSLILTNGDSAYDGGTIIDGGTLVAANSGGSATGTGPVTIGATGSLGSAAAGTISGHIGNSGTLIPGGAGGTGILTLNGGLTAEAGSNIDINFLYNSATQTYANGQLALAGADDATILSAPGGAQSVNINLADVGGVIQNRTYAIATYPTGTNLSNFDQADFNVVHPATGVAQGPNTQLTLTNNSANHEIDLTITGAANYITWTGDATGSGAWDINTSQNWTLQGSPVTFDTYDDVTFDDSANGSGDVTVNVDAGGVNPSRVTFNNNSRNYAVSGGAIGGNGSLNVNGSGTVTLASANSYTGGTVVNQGTLVIAGDSSLGTAPATPAVNLSLNKTSTSSISTIKFLNDTTLAPTRNVLISQSAGGGGPVIDTNGHDVTIPGQIFAGNNGANLLKQGNGTLTLTGDNSTNIGGGYIGAVFVYAGALNASQDVSLGSAGGGINLSGGTLQYGASFNPTGRPVTVTGSGTIDTNGFDSTIDGVLGGGGALTKIGSGTLTLNNPANTFTGTATVAGGVLSVASPLTTAAGIVASAGGTLQIAPGVGGSVINTATLSLAGGSLDITNNTLVFDTTVDTHDEDSLETALANAYDRGAWDLPGITSSTAAGSGHISTVGWNYDSSANTFTVAYTLPGDTNLDGSVNGMDMTNLSQGIGWDDFNYDGKINADDWALMMLGASYGNISAVNSVPEPASLFLPALGAMILLRRRRSS